jgi:hypothetical protein
MHLDFLRDDVVCKIDTLHVYAQLAWLLLHKTTIMQYWSLEFNAAKITPN